MGRQEGGDEGGEREELHDGDAQLGPAEGDGLKAVGGDEDARAVSQREQQQQVLLPQRVGAQQRRRVGGPLEEVAVEQRQQGDGGGGARREAAVRGAVGVVEEQAVDAGDEVEEEGARGEREGGAIDKRVVSPCIH